MSYAPTADETAEANDWTFGDHVTAPQALEPGVYDAIVKTVKIAKDRETGQIVEDEQSGKRKIDVRFEVPEYEDDHGKPLTVDQRITISFGQNSQTKAWSMMAQFVQATTGIVCGSQEQYTVGPPMIVGKRVRIMVDVKDSGYNKVTKIMPPAQAAKRGAAPQQPSALNNAGDELDDEIPF